MKSIPKSEVIHSGIASMQKECERRYKTAQRELSKAADDLAELKSEVLNAIRGKSKFAPELLNELIAQLEQEMTVLENARNEVKRELDGVKHRVGELMAQYDEVITWTELYDSADLTAKKMIVANLINRIEVGANYKLHIDFNIDLSQFKISHDFCA